MSHFRLAVTHYIHQNVEQMLDAYNENKNQVAINSEAKGDEYYFNPCGMYDYYTLLEKDLPYTSWVEKIVAPGGRFEMAQSVVTIDGRWIEFDDLNLCHAGEYFERINKKNGIYVDVEDLYVDIYDCHK